MIDAALFRSVRIRSYREVVCDAGRIFRLALGVKVRAVLKRVALAAVAKVEGWTLRVFTLERTKEEERIAVVPDCLARCGMEGHDFAAAVTAALDGSCAFLAIAIRNPKPVKRVSSALSRQGTDPDWRAPLTDSPALPGQTRSYNRLPAVTHTR